jgi:beta-glucosidase
MSFEELIVVSMDLEMPGPVRRRGKYLVDACKNGVIKESEIEESTARVLELLYKTGKSQIPDWKESKEQTVDLLEHRSILRHTAAEGG